MHANTKKRKQTLTTRAEKNIILHLLLMPPYRLPADLKDKVSVKFSPLSMGEQDSATGIQSVGFGSSRSLVRSPPNREDAAATICFRSSPLHLAGRSQVG